MNEPEPQEDSPYDPRFSIAGAWVRLRLHYTAVGVDS